MASTIEVESVTPGYNWTLKRGMGVRQDNNGNSFYTPPEEVHGGWARTEAAARSRAQAFAESLDEE